MPCITYPDEYGPKKNKKAVPTDNIQLATQLATQETEMLKLRNTVNILTDLLCKTGRARYNKTHIPPEVLNWWVDHCKWDEERGEPW